VYRYPAAIASGLALWVAFPSHDLWPMAPVGVALLAIATRGAPAWQGALLGLIGGLSCFVPLLSWSGIYVGALPWIALAVLESGYVALLGLACALLQGHPSRFRRAERRSSATGAGVSAVLRVRPLVVALAWVAQEALRGSTPFGGFPWGRLAFSQADSPLAGLAALGGAPAVTFGVALAGGLLAAAAVRLSRKPEQTEPAVERGRPGIRLAGSGRRVLAAASCLLGAVAVIALPLFIPRPVDGPTGRFMAVQGNVPRAGLDFNAERRAVLDNHAQATRKAAAAVDAGDQPRPDLVVWPENASDIDPLRNPDAAAVISEAVDAIGAPIVLGAVLQEPPPAVSNASLLYLPGKGVSGRYVKQHPVPFAEYIPFRSFFRRFSDKVDLVASDFTAGTGPGVFRLRSHVGSRPIAAGAIICFEVAYDALMRDTVTAGANVLLVQTNNATFGFTDESVQQLAISRIRAIEHGRSIVHVSTVGVSALITPDGTAHQRTALFSSAVLAADLPLRTERTIADRLGGWPEYAACAVLTMMLVLRFPRRRRR